MTEYVLKTDVIRSCLKRLIEQPIHRLFPGYLCLQQQSSIEGKTTNLQFPYTEFFDTYLRINGPESNMPYFVPFSLTEDPALETLWLNENVAGTYAPSSLRPSAPLRKITEIRQTGRDSRWNLFDDHWKLARLELGEGQRIPVESLSAYLLRDYGFIESDPSAFTVVRTYAEEFGYDVSGHAFSHLYKTGDSKITEDSFVKHE